MRAVVRRGRRRVVAAIGVCGVAVAVVVWFGLDDDGDGDGSASASSSSTSVATAAIERRDLVERDSEDGTLGYADRRDVVNHLDGTVTWVPDAGRVVRPDHALYKVDAKAVILMHGTQPAYRALSSATSSSGRDVRQLEHDLRALGDDPDHAMAVDGTWTSQTTAAVERWQKRHGFTQDGKIELGRIVFAPHSRRVATVSLTLGASSAAAGGGGAAAAGASATASPSAASGTTRTAGLVGRSSRPRAVFASYRVVSTTTPTPAPTTTTTPAPTATGPTTTTPPASTTPAPTATATTPSTPAPTTTAPTTTTGPATTTPPTTTSPAPATSATPRPSAGAGAATPSASAGTGSGSGAGASASAAVTSNTVMTTTSTTKVVTVELPTTKASVAKLRAKVTVELPAGGTVHGRITAIGKVATAPASTDSGSSSSSKATIAVDIRLSTTVKALDQAPVTVSFEESRVKDALAIPVTALLAQPGGRFAVEVVDAGTRRRVAVTPGVYTSGYVQISGSGLRPGLRVTNAAIQ